MKEFQDSFWHASAVLYGQDAQIEGSKHDVLFRVQNHKGLVKPNGPQKHNALTRSSLRRIRTFLEFAKKQDLDFVLVEGIGGEAFCSENDGRLITKVESEAKSEYYRELYQLNYEMSRLTIPLISIVDAATAGSGVGIAMSAKHRIGTRNAIFSMREAKVGAFSGNGVSSFLPGLGPLGMYMGLTGEKWIGSDLYDSGLINHFCDDGGTEGLEQDLIQVRERSEIAEVLEKYRLPIADRNSKGCSLASILPWIEETFDGKSVEEILGKLNRIRDEKPSSKEWARKTTNTMLASCPFSLKLCHKLLSMCKGKDVKECLELEFRAISRICTGRDFAEGAHRAHLGCNGHRPHRSVSDLKSVTESMLEDFVAPLPEELFARRSLPKITDRPKVEYFLSATEMTKRPGCGQV